MHSFAANILNAVARLIGTYGDNLKDDLFKERVGAVSVKQLSRTAKERRPGSLGYTEAMIVLYNRKCKYPLPWKKLYEKNQGLNDTLDEADTEEDEAGENNGSLD